MQKNKSVDDYLSNLTHWKQEVLQLRTLLKDSELEETMKWGMPTYTLKGKNVIGLSAFESYFGLWFHQGVFLSDPNNLLINAQQGKTKGMRQLRWQSTDFDRDLITTYIQEAIANEKAGKRIQAERASEIRIPPELQVALQADEELTQAFNGMTPGKQKEYAQYINEAKRESTRTSRLNKIIPMIKSGQGLNDKYR